MKILKKIGIALAALIVLLCIISLFLPGTMHVERSVTINAPAEIVFDQVNTLKNWEQWSPWLKMDTTMDLTYAGPAAGTGAGYSWTSQEMGTGKMTLTDSKPNEIIDTRLEFGDNGGANSVFHFTADGNAIKVTNSFDSDKSMNPIHKYMSIFMRGFLETQMGKGLNDIKKIAESMPPPAIKPDITIENTTVKAQNYLAIRDTVSFATIGQKLGMYYGMIGEVMKKQNLNFAGQPFAIYYNDSQTNWDMDAAIPVDKAGKADGKVMPGEIKAGNAVVAHYFGAYEGLGSAHIKIKEWLTSNNKKATGAPWEVYVSDPGVEKDTAKWQTDVYYPIE